MPTNRTIQRWYFDLLLPYRWRLFFILLLVSLHSLCPAVIVFLTESILDDALLTANPDAILWLPIIIVVLYAVNGGLHVLRSMLSREIAWRLVTSVRQQLFTKQLNLSVQWRQKKKLGEILSTLSDDVSAMQYIVSAVITIIQKPLSILGLLYAAYTMNPVLTGTVIIALPIVLLPIRWLKQQLRTAANDELQAMAQLRSQAAETFSHFSEIQLQRAQQQQQQLFKKHNHQLYHQKMHHILLQVSISPLLELLAATGLGAALYVGAQQIAQGESSASEILAFLVAIGLLSAPLKGLSEALPLWQKSMVGATRVWNAMNSTDQITDFGKSPIPPQIRSLTVEKLYFSYQQEPLFSDITLNIPVGSNVVITGTSGSGKSTLIHLFLRLIEPQQGAITLNGTPIEHYPLNDYRSLFSVLSQDPLLFHDTILSNLTMGRDIPLLDVQHACSLAHIHDFIMTLGLNYHTPIAEMGTALSGGQQQRLCIARALLLQAPFLILDEPFAGLELSLQRSIWDNIVTTYEGKTIILITHQPWLWKKIPHVIDLMNFQNRPESETHYQ